MFRRLLRRIYIYAFVCCFRVVQRVNAWVKGGCKKVDGIYIFVTKLASRRGYVRPIVQSRIRGSTFSHVHGHPLQSYFTDAMSVCVFAGGGRLRLHDR